VKSLLAQLGRFATVGVAATLIHVGLAWLMARGFGTPPLIANAIGFAAAFACSYLGHFYWTFGQREGHPVRLPKFLIVSGTGFAVTNLITWITVTAALPVEVALFAILATVPAITWALSRFWAFRTEP
jgi:putative flippase GtrA